MAIFRVGILHVFCPASTDKTLRMTVPPAHPPNDTISQLIDAVGLEGAQDLIRTYLREFDGLIRNMAAGDREIQHRATHALKSSSRHMGLLTLARRLEALEARLLLPNGKIQAEDLMAITEEFERTAKPLRTYVAGR